MTNFSTESATGALNDEEYINKIYDSIHNKQTGMLKEHYTDNTAALDTEKQNVQQQTEANLERTDVESQKLQQGYKPQNVSSVVDQQASLAMENQKRKNVSTLRDVQSEADAEIERQRLLMGQQFAAAIKQAQANNDMAKAQQLYAAAKEQDERFRSMKANAGSLMASIEDNSVLDSIVNGLQSPTFGGATWADVLKHEESINTVYDNAIEADRQQAQMTVDAMLSKIRAEQEARTKATDKALTDAYVSALRQGKNYNEVQNTYGLGSGNKAQAQLARGIGLTGDLTALRGVQMGANANAGIQRVGAGQTYRDAVMRSVAANDANRAGALYGAAADEEAALITQQQAVGKQLADQGDFSVLGKLYGLTDEQIGKLNAAWAEQEVAKKAAEEEAARKQAEAEAKKKAETNQQNTSDEGSDLPKEETEERYTGWKDEKLQAMANAVVANFEANRTPLTEEQKEELTTDGAMDESIYIKNALAEARRAEKAAAEAAAAEKKRREEEQDAKRRAEEAERKRWEEEKNKAIVASVKKNPGSARKPTTRKQFEA